eukprot:866997-Pleurochrysis_carterae.AAC.4
MCPPFSALQFRYAHYEATQNQLRGLGQTLHRKVFQPVRREIEGRKDLEKRLSDRKKVRLDYDAYRRKQMGLLTTDPANKREYEANLEQARMTFQRHSQARPTRLPKHARAARGRARRGLQAHPLARASGAGRSARPRSTGRGCCELFPQMYVRGRSYAEQICWPCWHVGHVCPCSQTCVLQRVWSRAWESAIARRTRSARPLEASAHVLLRTLASATIGGVWTRERSPHGQC